MLRSTPLWEFYQPILKIIVAAGGECARNDIEAAIEKSAETFLKPGDRRLLFGGRERWRFMIQRAKKSLRLRADPVTGQEGLEDNCCGKARCRSEFVPAESSPRNNVRAYSDARLDVLNERANCSVARDSRGIASARDRWRSCARGHGLVEFPRLSTPVHLRLRRRLGTDSPLPILSSTNTPVSFVSAAPHMSVRMFSTFALAGLAMLEVPQDGTPESRVKGDNRGPPIRCVDVFTRARLPGTGGLDTQTSSAGCRRRRGHTRPSEISTTSLRHETALGNAWRHDPAARALR